MRQDRREEVKLQQARIFSLFDTQGSAQKDELTVSANATPGPGLAPKLFLTRLNCTKADR